MDKPSVFPQVEPFLLLKFTTGLKSSVHVIKELLWWVLRILRRLNAVSATQFFYYVRNNGGNTFFQLFIGVKNVPTNVLDENEEVVLFDIKKFERKHSNCCTVGILLIRGSLEKCHRAERYRVSKESAASVFGLDTSVYIQNNLSLLDSM